MAFLKIDKALSEYYVAMGKDNYYDDKKQGKFFKFIQENGFEEGDVDDELAQDPSDCMYPEFDEDFPLKPPIDDDHARQKEIFRIIKYCHDNGVSPISKPKNTQKYQHDEYIPKPWTKGIDQNGLAYYVNTETGQIRREPPVAVSTQYHHPNARASRLADPEVWCLVINTMTLKVPHEQQLRLFQKLKKIAEKLITKDDPKYRTLYLNNPKLQHTVLAFDGGLEFLYNLGFEPHAISRDKLVCHQVNIRVIDACLISLQHKIEQLMSENNQQIQFTNIVSHNDTMKNDNVLTASNQSNVSANNKIQNDKEEILRNLGGLGFGTLLNGSKRKWAACSVGISEYMRTKIEPLPLIGLSVGGAKDVNVFRKCIECDAMPSIHSITYNGLLYSYYFDTTTRKHVIEEDEKIDNDYDDDGSMLFYPSYCYARTRKLILDENLKNDVLNEYEYYMSVGLNSNIKQDEFKRKHLNLVVLLDISGSMNTAFDDNEDEVINIDEWRETLKVNDRINVKDIYNNGSCSWFGAEIVEIMKSEHDGIDKIKIHYIGYDEEYDKYIKANDARLAPFNHKSTKLLCGKNAFKSILKQLTAKDRLGIVTFNQESHTIQKLQFVGDVNMDKLTDNIMDIMAIGGTNFENGYTKSVELYAELFKVSLLNDNHDNYDNRIIILTDAQPNAGKTNPNSLLSMMSKHSKYGLTMNNIHNYPTPNKKNMDDHDLNNINHIYTTFIGIGLDFNSSLIQTISQTRGCNYYSVKSTKDFNQKMNEEFEYMVNPLVFNVCLKLKCEGNSCQIKKIYGSSNDEENNIMNNGEITRIDTLFPSKRSKESGDTKGGVQLIELTKNDNNNSDDINVELEVSFEDRNGQKYVNKQNVSFNPPKACNDDDMIEIDDDENINFYDNNGIRKAILLCKYVELIKKWIKHQGYCTNLKMSDEYKKLFSHFQQHFKKEMIKCNDDTLQKEVDIMNKLININ